MNKEQYLAMRYQLMNEAQALIDAGKAAEAEEKMKEVAALDEQWDAIAQAQANFRALNSEPRAFAPTGFDDTIGQNSVTNDVTQALDSEEYKMAWVKTLMGKQLTQDEASTYAMVNEAFTHNHSGRFANIRSYPLTPQLLGNGRRSA